MKTWYWASLICKLSSGYWKKEDKFGTLIFFLCTEDIRKNSHWSEGESLVSYGRSRNCNAVMTTTMTAIHQTKPGGSGLEIPPPLEMMA